MTINKIIYSRLLTQTLPRVIDSKKEYERVEAIFEELLDKGEKRSPEEDSLFDLLANLLEDYEKRSLPSLPESSPEEKLRFLMEQNGLKQTDLADIFGGQGNLSAILNGKREINKEQAKKLGERFRVSPLAFI